MNAILAAFQVVVFVIAVGLCESPRVLNFLIGRLSCCGKGVVDKKNELVDY